MKSKAVSKQKQSAVTLLVKSWTPTFLPPPTPQPLPLLSVEKSCLVIDKPLSSLFFLPPSFPVDVEEAVFYRADMILNPVISGYSHSYSCKESFTLWMWFVFWFYIFLSISPIHNSSTTSPPSFQGWFTRISGLNTLYFPGPRKMVAFEKYLDFSSIQQRIEWLCVCSVKLSTQDRKRMIHSSPTSLKEFPISTVIGAVWDCGQAM